MSKRKELPLQPIEPPAPQEARTPADGRLLLYVVLGLYLLLGFGTAMVVPFETPETTEVRLLPPDESAHWLYALELAQTRRLPVFSSGGGNYEAHQPPLYYVSILWATVAGGITAARVWGVLLGGATLVCVWQLSALLLGDRLWARVAATGALAFIPGRLFICSSVSNDPLFELLAVCTLWLCLLSIREGASPKRALLTGLLLALALLTKTSAVVLAPIVALALIIEPRWRTGGGLKSLLVNGLCVAAPVVLLWGWWVARNMALYGEPLALNIFQEIFGKDRPGPEFFLSRGMTWSGYWQLVAWQTWMSLWGVFGQATVYMPAGFYALGKLVAAAAALGVVVSYARARKSGLDRPDRLAEWLLAGLLTALTLAAFMRFNTVFYQAQARYFLAASAVMAAALAGAITGLAPRDREHVPAILLVLALAVMSVWALVAHVTGGYSFAPPGAG